MKVKISTLDGVALDWAVAECMNITSSKFLDGVIHFNSLQRFSSEWCHAGPIIEREKIYITDWPAPKWRAGFNWPKKHADVRRSPSHHTFDGPTPLIAAMRCYVSSVMGDENDEVDVPEELLKETNL